MTDNDSSNYFPGEAPGRCLRDMASNAADVGLSMRAATDALNAELDRAEQVFEEKLGLSATGRVVLKPRVHLVFRDGCFDVEKLRGRKPPSSTPLRNASREVRALAAGALRALWKNCGGMDLPP